MHDVRVDGRCDEFVTDYGADEHDADEAEGGEKREALRVIMIQFLIKFIIKLQMNMTQTKPKAERNERPCDNQ